MNTFADTERLAGLIDRKQRILVQLRDLSRRQLEMIGIADMNKLLSVLANKQSLLDELHVVQRDLDPYRGQDPDSRRWQSSDKRERCRGAVQRCEALLGEIMLMEKQSEATLVQRRDETAIRLDHTHTAQQASRAYTARSGHNTNHIDLSAQ